MWYRILCDSEKLRICDNVRINRPNQSLPFR